MTAKRNILRNLRFCLALIIVCFVSIQSTADDGRGRFKPKDSIFRPDITSLPPERLESEQAWISAHFTLMAFILEAYPKDTKIIVLGPQMEFLYDVGRLVTAGTPDEKRIELAYIIKSENPRELHRPGAYFYGGDYFRVFGLELKEDQKYLFVNTGSEGFHDSLNFVIKPLDKMPTDALDGNVKIHFLISNGTRQIPSASSFFVKLNPNYGKLEPHDQYQLLEDFNSKLPRTSLPLTSARVRDGLVELFPVINPRNNSAAVDMEASERFMRGIVAYWNDPKFKTQFEFERNQIRRLHNALLRGSDEDIRMIVQSLGTLSSPEELLVSAQVHDLIEAAVNNGITYELSLEDLGFFSEDSYTQGVYPGVRRDWLAKHPEWAPYFNNSKRNIRALFINEEWDTIEKLIRADVDPKLNEFLITHLYDSVASGRKRELQELMMLNAGEITDGTFIRTWMKQKQAIGLADLLGPMISRRNQNTYLLLAEHFFSRPDSHTKEILSLLRAVIAYSPSYNVLGYLRTFTFSQPHTDHPDYDPLRKALKIEDNKKRIKKLYPDGIPNTGSPLQLSHFSHSIDDRFAREVLKLGPKLCQDAFKK